MVLETAAISEQRHLVIGYRGGSDMAENNRDRSPTTLTPATSITPPLSSSPTSILMKDQLASIGPSDGDHTEVDASFVNGATSFSSHPHVKEEQSVDYDSEVQPNGRSLEKTSLLSPTVVKEEDLEETGVMTQKVKQEEELDAPLDFSLRRRDSVSESFTDDSRASSSNSPPPNPTFTSRISPDHSQHQQLHQFILQRQQRHDTAGGHDSQGLQVPQVNKSPSPDHGSKSKASLNSGRSPANMPLAALGMATEGSASGIPPAALATILGQNGGVLGSLGNLSALVSEARKAPTANGGKVQRPFKAYPKEALQMPLGYLGLPGVNPFPGIDPSILQGLTVLPEDMMTLYKQQAELLKEREKQMLTASKRASRSPPSSTLSSSPSPANGSAHVTKAPPVPPSSSSTIQAHLLQPTSTKSRSPSPHMSPQSRASPASPSSQQQTTLSSNHSATSTPTSSPFPIPSGASQVTSTSSATSGGSRKRPRTMPDNEKDDAYWERRRKNNDAAKRSRDARRAKEDEIAIRAALLEQENLKLRVEVAALKTETTRLRCLLYNT